jgi:hypothetical protein
MVWRFCLGLAGVLPHSASSLRQGFPSFLPELVLNHNPLISASQVAGIIAVNLSAWLLLHSFKVILLSYIILS